MIPDRNPLRLTVLALCIGTAWWALSWTLGPTPIETARAARPPGLLAGFGQSRGVIETSRNMCLLLELYLSDTPAHHAQGLMRIEHMDEFEGMLFRYSRAARITMWMKNTYIPLDMLFIREDGSIAGIEKNTAPLSTRRLSSPEPVSGVLEVNAGFADRWRIEPGDRLLTVN